MVELNRQLILLETYEGTARNENDLKDVWSGRLKECGATHYKIIAVRIDKGCGKK